LQILRLTFSICLSVFGFAAFFTTLYITTFEGDAGQCRSLDLNISSILLWSANCAQEFLSKKAQQLYCILKDDIHELAFWERDRLWAVMGPKKGAQKQQQQQKGKGAGQKNVSGKGSEAAGGSSTKNKGAAQVQISSENERKLRQLLQNTGKLSIGLPPGGKQPQEELSVGQKKSAGRRLRSIYDTLLAEGFSSSQIEQALAALSIVSS
jgi:hypothetical protein